MKKNKKIIYIITALIIIIGIIMWYLIGFNKELQYSKRNQIQISNQTSIELNDVKDIAKEVLGNVRQTVYPVEIFGNYVLIEADEITEEQKTQIIEKFNEKYSTKIEADDVEIINISATRVRDIVKRFITPGLITLIIILIYFIIRYRKMNKKEVILKTIFVPIITQLVFYSIIAICRIPLGKVTTAISVGLYVINIGILTNYFENNKKQIIQKSEENN